MNRRELLQSMSCGFGYLALAGLCAEDMHASSIDRSSTNPLAPRAPHFPAKAKRVIFMFMEGGPSQHESFDYNPEMAMAATKSQKMLAPLFKFEKQGQSGIPVSELFPNVAKQIDQLCILNGMNTDSPAHAPATLLLHTGSFTDVRPSLGSWVVYGLGSEAQSLPAFIAINPVGPGGAQNYGSAFLPSSYQGTRYLTKTGELPNIVNPNLSSATQREQLDLVQFMNQRYLRRATADPELEGVIQSLEMAFRMQTEIPTVLDISREPEAMRKMYGVDAPETRDFGTQCLLARRLAEAGVRFIQLSYPGWDQHSDIRERIVKTAYATDRPIAALIADLKQRGLLEDTLVVWGGEFGRTTTWENEGSGRGHEHRGYTMWMAGGGVKPGFRYGAHGPG